MSENVRTALITATAVLFGGFIAGAASVVTTVVNQNGETARTERRVDEEARGAARLLHTRFLTVAAAVNITLDQGSYLSALTDLPVPAPSAADMKQVYTRLTTAEFEDVTEAIAAAQAFSIALSSEDGKRVRAEDRPTLDEMRGTLADGGTALLDVADLDLPPA